MHLEQRPTHILIQSQSEITVQFDQPRFEFIGGRGILNTEFEKRLEEAQGELIHMINIGEIHNREEQYTRPLSHRLVPLTSFIDFNLGFLTVFHPLGDFV